MGVISLRFSDEEEAQIRKLAGKEKVSKYLKRKILEPKVPNQNENISIEEITMMMHSITKIIKAQSFDTDILHAVLKKLYERHPQNGMRIWNDTVEKYSKF
jgi:predicted house-cleaning noncanonical NTP pyrophosphatase (MazG superfamily)